MSKFSIEALCVPILFGVAVAHQSNQALAERDGELPGISIVCPRFDCFQNYTGTGQIECCLDSGNPGCEDDGGIQKGFYGTCERTGTTGFTKNVITGYYASTSSADFTKTTWYSSDWGGGTVHEPNWVGQNGPIYLLKINEPVTGSVVANWMLIQWDNNGTGGLTGEYVVGRADVNTATGGLGSHGLGVNLTGQWDVNGDLYWESNVPMRGDWNPFGFNPGFYRAYDNADSSYLNGSAFFNRFNEGYNVAIDSATGSWTRLTAFFPSQALSPSDFENRTFAGIIWDGNVSVTLPEEILPIRVTTTSGGVIRFTMNPFSDPEGAIIRDRSHYDGVPGSVENNWWDSYFDFRVSDFNYPTAGALAADSAIYGKMNRFGFRAGSGKVSCMAHKSALFGLRMFCSAQASDQADRPISFVLHSYDGGSASDPCASFGTDGLATSNFTGIFGADLTESGANAIASKDNGGSPEVWLAGHTKTASTGGGFAATKFIANGTLDTTFSGDGMFETQIGDASTEASARDIVIQSDGKVVLAGYSTISAQTEVTLLRLNDNGTTDSGFGSSGVITEDFGKSGNFILEAVTMDGSGNFYVAGSYTETGAKAGFVGKLNSAGAPVTGFGTNGLALFDSSVVDGSSSPSNVAFYDLVVQTDGKIVVAGGEWDASVNALAGRLNTDGTADNSFATNGFRLSTGNGFQSSILIADQLDSSGDEEYYTAGGLETLDHTYIKWANDGSVLDSASVDAYSSGSDFSMDMAYQPDGKLVTTGYGNGKMIVTRLSEALDLDGDFNTTGYRNYTTPADAGVRGHGILIDSTQRILVGGGEFSSGGEEMTLYCVQP